MSQQLLVGDAEFVLRTRLKDQSIQCCVTSPPYFGLRDYQVVGQLGLEATPDLYVQQLVAVFREVRRVLKDDGTVWLNLGDSYAGSWGAQSRPNGNDAGSTLQGGSLLSARQILAHPKTTQTGSLKNTPGMKSKDLMGIPWMVAFALRTDGWYLRQDIIWHKPNLMPESVRDRCTKAHEYLFLLTKSEKYFWDAAAMQEPATGRDPGNRTHKGATQYAIEDSEQHRTKAGLVAVGPRETRNRRSVWTITTTPYREAHFATFPPKLVEPCILAGSHPGSWVLDPFMGSGTVGMVAKQHGRHFVGIDLNQTYHGLAEARIAGGR